MVVEDSVRDDWVGEGCSQVSGVVVGGGGAWDVPIWARA